MTRTVGLLIVALALLALAGLFYTKCSADDPAPDDEFVEFRCTACGETFRLSYEEFEKVWDRGDFRQEPGRGVLFKCARCGEFAAKRSIGADEDDAAGDAGPEESPGPRDTSTGG